MPQPRRHLAGYCESRTCSAKNMSHLIPQCLHPSLFKRIQTLQQIKAEDHSQVTILCHHKEKQVHNVIRCPEEQSETTVITTHKQMANLRVREFTDTTLKLLRLQRRKQHERLTLPPSTYYNVYSYLILNFLFLSQHFYVV